MKHPIKLLTTTALMTVGLSSSLAMAQDMDFGDRGLRLKDKDAGYDFRIGGRVHLDTANFDSKTVNFKDDSDVRRLRVYLAGKLGDDFKFKIDRDIGGTSTGWKNVWIDYSGIKNVNFRAGNLIAPFGMEDQASSNNIPFMERSLVSALTPGYYMGAMAHYTRRHYSASVGYFGEALSTNDLNKSQSSGKGVVARVTYTPLNRRKHVLHVGASVERRDLDAGADLKLSTRPEVGLSNTSLVSTGGIAGVRRYTNIGVEGAWMEGPLSVQAEWVNMRADRVGTDLNFGGFYAQVAYVLTGETRQFSRNSHNFGKIAPKDWGAVEVAARYSQIDLKDGLIQGGKQNDWTLGVNYYLNKNVRVMANYVHANANPSRWDSKDKMNALQARLQIAF